MEIGVEPSEEYARIAFLLGSALRNEDSEQFLELYDTVLTRDLSSQQLDQLKESARAIADLPDAEYCELLSEPSKFSLIPTDRLPDIHASEALRSVSNNTGSDSGISSYPVSTPTMDLTGEEVPCKPNLDALSRTSRHFTVKPTAANEAEQREDDSGVFNSSKNTTGSEIEPESPDPELEDERVGYFDYFGTETEKKLVPKPKNSTNPEREVCNTKAYDAVFDAVDCDDIELYDRDPPGVYGASTYRARKKFEDKLYHDNMTEMTTFSRSGGSDSSENYDEDLVHDAKMAHMREINRHLEKRNEQQYDEAISIHSGDDSHNSSLEEVVIESDPRQNTSGDSSDEQINQDIQDKVNIHQKLYAQSDYQSGYSNYKYSPLNNSDEEDRDYQPRFNSCSTYNRARCYDSSSSEVHGKIQFPLKVTQSNRVQYLQRHGLTAEPVMTSDTVKVEKSIKTRNKPPFDDPLDFRRISSSTTERLLDYPRQNVEAPNMPVAAPIGDKSIKDEEKKKKKRKKKKESGEKGETGQRDENGNPVEDKPSSFSRDPKKILSPSSNKVDVYNNDHFSAYEKSKFPSELLSMEHHFPGRFHSPIMPELEEHSSNSETYGKMQARRAKKERRLQKVKEVKSEEISGYMGEKNIDEIMSMIEGNAERNTNSQTNNKKKKTGVPVPPTPTDAGISPPTSEINDSVIADKEQLPNKTKKKKRKSGNAKESSVDGNEKDSSSVTLEKDSDESSIGSDQAKDISVDNSIKPTSNGIDDISSLHNASNYIFTDFDEPARVQEAEFVMVAKKKKPSALRKDREQGSYFSRDMYVKEKVNQRREFFPSRPPPERGFSADNYEREKERRPLIERQANSVGSPPPTPTQEPANPAVTVETERSFSPSQFPVLSAKPSSRVGRRNSTGSAPAPDVNYDSEDMESVKSVPLVIGNGVAQEAGGSTSPGSVSGPVGISYASIAAGKKPKASSSVSSGGSTQKLTPTTPPEVEVAEAKPAALAPATEPEEQISNHINQEISSTTGPSVDAKPAASSDTTTCEATFVLPDNDTNTEEPVNGINEINVSVNLTLPPPGEEGQPEYVSPCPQCEEESVEYTYKFSETNPNILECIARPVVPPHSHSDSNKRSQQISAETRVTAVESGAPTSQQQPKPVTSRPSDSDISDNYHSHINRSHDGNFQQAPEPSSAVTSKTGTGKTKRAAKLSKSVIFFNEKMNQPTNLGISFGFDDEDVGDFPPLPNTVVSANANNVHSGQGDESGGVSFGGSYMSSQPKIKAGAPPNGVVIPQGIAIAAPVDNTVLNHMQNPTPAESKMYENRIAITVNNNNREKLPKNSFQFAPPKDYRRDEDPNFVNGYFDREQACSYLFRGWQEIQALRTSGKVKMYEEIS